MVHPLSDDWSFFYLGKRHAHAGIVGDLLAHTGPVAVDIETVSLEDRTIIGVGFGTDPDNAYFIRRDSPLIPVRMLEDPHILKIFHNSEFDVPSLESHYNIKINNFTDTLVAARVMGYPPRLSSLTEWMFGRTPMEIKELLAKYNATDMLGVPLEETARKCGNDVKNTWEVYHAMLSTLPMDALELDLEVIPALRKIERRGMRLDLNRLNEHGNTLRRDVRYFRTICEGQFGFNPGSNAQAAPVLRSRGLPIKYGKPTPKTGKRNVKLNREILESKPYNQDALAILILMFRQKRSLLKTVIESSDEKRIDDLLFVRFLLTSTDSGRLSTSPNVQNWTKDLRDIIIHREGNRLEVGDFSQIELRVLNYFAKDPVMDDAFQLYDSGKGPSIHTVTQNSTGSTYKVAKNINFTVIYLGDAHTLENRYGIPYHQGEVFIQKYFETYPDVKRWLESTENLIRRQGYSETLLGRRRNFPWMNDPGTPGWKKDASVREGINHIIQGTAGEINKRCLIMMAGEPVVNDVHDELVVDVEDGRKVHWPEPSDLAPFLTPIEVGVGKHWKEAKP